MNTRPNIYQTLRRFLNSESIGDNIRVAAMCDSTDDVEQVTRWKAMNKNPKYTTRMYVSHLNTLGFLTRVKQGVYRLNAHIPDWCDLGVIWYARGYMQFDVYRGQNRRTYKGLTCNEWKAKITEEIKTFQHCLPSIEILGQVAPVQSAPVDAKESDIFSGGKLTSNDWAKLTALFVTYCSAGQRAGQAYMNALLRINSSLHTDVSGTEADCFYDDAKILDFVRYLNSEKMMKLFPKLGNHVKTKTHGHSGVVYQIHHSFKDTSEDMYWFKSQRPALSTETLEKPWVSILQDNAGAILVPISDIAEITSKVPHDNGNTWFSFYFDK